jgi:deoxyribose-phosphate aldolase
MNTINLARMVDHTVLRPETSHDDIVNLCSEANALNVFAVCVPSSWVHSAALALAQSPVAVATVVGFPSGAVLTAVKAFEAQKAIVSGADEIDMVINLGALKSGDWDLVSRDILTVRQASIGSVLKVIIEAAALTDDEIRRVCRVVADSGADFVKTSTGFHPNGGATVQQVQLMRDSIPDGMGLKASGGIRTLEQALAMVDAGATRLGMSATRSILQSL